MEPLCDDEQRPQATAVLPTVLGLPATGPAGPEEMAHRLASALDQGHTPFLVERLARHGLSISHGRTPLAGHVVWSGYRPRRANRNRSLKD